MIQRQEIEQDTIWSEDKEHLLPKITSLILEGVHSEYKDRDMDFKLFRHRKKSYRNKFVHHFRLPSYVPTSKDISITKMPREEYGGRPICITHHHGHKRFVRLFIGGLSHCYNNLLMGIWGYASLIGMTLEKGHPIQSRLNQIESMIQNGSNLIHLLFGYIVERRTAAKRLRLKQLIQEIKSYNRVSGNDIDFDLIESCIVEISKIENKTKLASCLTRIMEHMLTMVQEKCHLIKAQDLACLPNIEGHLEKIDALLMRGFQMIRNLDYYAEAIVPQKKKVSLKSIIRRQIANANSQHPHVTITQDLSAPIPKINIDSHQIEYALSQLIENAINAVAENGIIHIQTDTPDSEKPLDRFGLHMLSTYFIISVSDNGKGMATETQAKIFEPFFTTSKGQSRAGLGLAAAAGIIKCHGGYIQVRSNQGIGSSVKIYLPNS